MKKIQSLILALVLASVVFSCKKSDPAVDPKVAIIGKWRITALKVNLGPISQDGYASFDACEKDNYTELRSPNIAIEDEGSTKCNASDPQQVRTGIWSLNAANTILTIDGEVGTILELTNSVLRVKASDASLGLEINTTYTKIQ